ncbi:hypothetical protein C731_2124 [Mycolicibacterium hassiacum DSM 44199]|uniref:Uncharacterized protein n=1 Tax=Mycolicibacterium hassiacum (strain DSM 44199 / CIP 105218 / JCM 12690 / 3849) TaxID=1122247 RepID=K5BG79_MYCHD|nr:hypothetical protein [Mycolicibacterium hassiacum]EKF23756.1 hypothetical protein C731_2124 [Mycolicibacterium hassiacum DSM 44199]
MPPDGDEERSCRASDRRVVTTPVNRASLVTEQSLLAEHLAPDTEPPPF